MNPKKGFKAIIFALILLALFASSASASKIAYFGDGGLAAKAIASSKVFDQLGALLLEDEKPSPHYDSILYSEIGPRLADIAADSNRVRNSLSSFCYE